MDGLMEWAQWGRFSALAWQYRWLALLGVAILVAGYVVYHLVAMWLALRNR